MTALRQNDRIPFGSDSHATDETGCRRGPRMVAAVAFPLILILFYTAFAQKEDAVIRVDTELAAFEVSVADSSGRPVRNLKADDFRVFEDGVERGVDFFQPIKRFDKSRPMSVVFALDVSGSMTDEELAGLQNAMKSFIKRLADYNSQFAIMTFAMEVKTLRPFTKRPEDLEKSFSRIRRDANGLSTHAYDAIDDAIRLLDRKTPKTIGTRIPRKAVLVITDGFPVGDVVEPQTVIERANASEATVYSVIMPSFSRLSANRRPLLTPFEASGLVEKTGGKSIYASDGNLEPIFDALAEELTSSYALAFYPTPPSPRSADFRQVRIESVKGFHVTQNRGGYRTVP